MIVFDLHQPMSIMICHVLTMCFFNFSFGQSSVSNILFTMLLHACHMYYVSHEIFCNKNFYSSSTVLLNNDQIDICDVSDIIFLLLYCSSILFCFFINHLSYVNVDVSVFWFHLWNLSLFSYAFRYFFSLFCSYICFNKQTKKLRQDKIQLEFHK